MDKKYHRKPPVCLEPNEYVMLAKRALHLCSYNMRPTDNAEGLWILLMMMAGLRVAEVAALPRRCVDLDNRALRIAGKGGVTRDVPICEPLWKALVYYVETSWPDVSPWMFDGRGDEHVSSRWVQLRTIQTLRSLGLDREGMTCHSLRHSFATRLLDSGVALPTIQGLLGHSSLASTQYYLHVNDRSRRDAVERISPSGLTLDDPLCMFI